MRIPQLTSQGNKPLSVLVLAPHTDDAEFGCGGTIAKLVEQGAKVHVRAFSLCRNQALQEEFRTANQLLGASCSINDFPVRRFHENRQRILDDLILMRHKLAPDVVFLPNTHDIHQDHEVIAREGIRAFKHCTILGYELPWNSFRMETTAFVLLEDHHVDTKVAAVREYQSQLHRPYADPEAVRAVCRMRGTAIGTRYAEAFQSIRQIL